LPLFSTIVAPWFLLVGFFHLYKIPHNQKPPKSKEEMVDIWCLCCYFSPFYYLMHICHCTFSQQHYYNGGLQLQQLPKASFLSHLVAPFWFSLIWLAFHSLMRLFFWFFFNVNYLFAFFFRAFFPMCF
jgi:hypothetical protein